MSNTTTFENAKVNDKIWSIKDRKWYYIKIIHANYLTIASVDDKLINVCNFDGSIGNDEFQSYFWDEIEIIAPVKPKPKLKVDTKVIVWNYNSTHIRHNQYFSHFDATGRIHVFVDGRTSWSNDNRCKSSWDCWELAEED